MKVKKILTVSISIIFMNSFAFAQNEQVEIKAKSERILYFFQTANYDSLSNLINEVQKPFNSPVAIASNYNPIAEKYGNIKSFRYAGYKTYYDQINIEYVAKTAYNIDILVQFSFNRFNQKLILYRFLEAFKNYAIPDYAIAEKYEEEPIKFAADSIYPLTGFLIKPISSQKVPLVIIIPDAGPTDADGIYVSKPYKDIATGLASNGYAVFRYNKRSLSYGFSFSQAKINGEPFTSKLDVLDDLQAVIDLLKTNPAIDSNRVYLLGHGEGAYLAPYVASKNPKLKGIILMNANANHPLEMMIDQNNYLVKILPHKKEHFDEDNQKAKIVLKNKVKENTPYSLLPHDLPASYWLWINSYNQIKTAKKLTLPMFIMQGARDYQVDKKNFAMWQKKLKKNANVSFKMYDKMNHIMHEGVGESTFSEYSILQHIPVEVINDLLNWMNKN